MLFFSTGKTHRLALNITVTVVFFSLTHIGPTAECTQLHILLGCQRHSGTCRKTLTEAEAGKEEGEIS